MRKPRPPAPFNLDTARCHLHGCRKRGAAVIGVPNDASRPLGWCSVAHSQADTVWLAGYPDPARRRQPEPPPRPPREAVH